MSVRSWLCDYYIAAHAVGQESIRRRAATWQDTIFDVTHSVRTGVGCEIASVGFASLAMTGKRRAQSVIASVGEGVSRQLL
jgi:hypothetical protein